MDKCPDCGSDLPEKRWDAFGRPLHTPSICRDVIKHAHAATLDVLARLVSAVDSGDTVPLINAFKAAEQHLEENGR